MCAEQIPAEYFLDHAISALEAADAAELRRLADCVSSVVMPVSQGRYRRNRDVFAALLEATGRNLRLLHRATEQKSSGYSMPILP